MWSCCEITSEVPENFQCRTTDHTCCFPYMGRYDSIAHRLRIRSRERLHAFIKSCSNPARFDCEASGSDIREVLNHAEYVITVMMFERGGYRSIFEITYANKGKRGAYTLVKSTEKIKYAEEVDLFDELLVEAEFECEEHDVYFKVSMHSQEGSLKIPEAWNRKLFNK